MPGNGPVCAICRERHPEGADCPRLVRDGAGGTMVLHDGSSAAPAQGTPLPVNPFPPAGPATPAPVTPTPGGTLMQYSNAVSGIPAPAVGDPLVGQMVGSFRVIRRLGHGGMG